jgi:single-strand DNA-binding protein
MLRGAIIGNLGNDPEMRYSANGTALLRFNVASNYRVRDQDGQYQDRVEWVRVTVLGARAESLSQYLHKGSKVYADGRLEARPWTDQQGQMRSGLELIANEVQFMSARNEGEDSGGSRGNGYSDGGQHQPAAAGARPQQNRQPQQVMDDADSDLPF